MLNDEKLWFIEEEDLNKKAVSVEAGAKIISSDCKVTTCNLTIRTYN